MPIDNILKIENFKVGDTYSRLDVADTGHVPRPAQPRDWTGIVQFQNCVLLFVTLDKTGFVESNQYHDVFDDGGATFYWDSQRQNTEKTPAISRIINGDTVLLFVRITGKVSSKTQPFVYQGKLAALDYDGEKPVQFVYEVLSYDSVAPQHMADIYQWRPKGVRKLRPIEATADKLPKSGKPQKKRDSGQGRLIDPKKKKAIEVRAMDVASAHYISSGYLVTDTSANSPFDLECKKGNELRRVEVKGTTQSAKTVSVTANEVKSARSDDCETDLFMVHGITIYAEAGEYTADGGEVKLVSNWVPLDEHLIATAYTYVVQ